MLAHLIDSKFSDRSFHLRLEKWQTVPYFLEITCGLTNYTKVAYKKKKFTSYPIIPMVNDVLYSFQNFLRRISNADLDPSTARRPWTWVSTSVVTAEGRRQSRPEAGGAAVNCTREWLPTLMDFSHVFIFFSKLLLFIRNAGPTMKHISAFGLNLFLCSETILVKLNSLGARCHSGGPPPVGPRSSQQGSRPPDRQGAASPSFLFMSSDWIKQTAEFTAAATCC